MIVHTYLDEQFYTARLIQIVSRAPLYLRERGSPGEFKVCRAISNVWEAIPSRHCKSIQSWVKSQHHFRRLTIDVLPASEFDDRRVCAWFDTSLRLVAFKSYEAVAMPMVCLRAVVAHELAHVVQASRGNPMALGVTRS